MQISTKPQPSKKLIEAGLPKNISAADKLALENKWNEQARIRNEAIERETKIPDEASEILHFQLRKFGKHWNAYYKKGVKFFPVLAAPSLLSSAMELLTDKMADQALKV